MISHIAPTDMLVGRYNNSNSFSCFRGAMRLLLIALYKYPYLLTYLDFYTVLLSSFIQSANLAEDCANTSSVHIALCKKMH